MQKKPKAKQLAAAVRRAFNAQLKARPDPTRLTIAYSTDG